MLIKKLSSLSMKLVTTQLRIPTWPHSKFWFQFFGKWPHETIDQTLKDYDEWAAMEFLVKLAIGT